MCNVYNKTRVTRAFETLRFEHMESWPNDMEMALSGYYNTNHWWDAAGGMFKCFGLHAWLRSMIQPLQTTLRSRTWVAVWRPKEGVGHSGQSCYCKAADSNILCISSHCSLLIFTSLYYSSLLVTTFYFSSLLFTTPHYSWLLLFNTFY